MQTTTLVSMFIASFTTFVVIYLLRPFAISINLVDAPSNRKLHQGSIPLIGGIAMYIGVVISILISPYDLNQYNYFLMATLIIVMVGILDDHQDISVSLRLLLQVLVALIVVSVGSTTIESFGNLFGGGEIILSEWAYLVSILAIIAGMNAVNMADGIHGLAGGNSLITCIAIVYLSKDSVSYEILFIVLLLCSVLPVFLIHNLCLGISESKRVFMGDTGSMFIGLTIVWVLIGLSQGEDRAFAPVTALWLFALPLIELVTAVLRRLTRRKSPFKSDLYHSHHLLIHLGVKEKNTLIFLLLISLLMAIIGMLGELNGVPERLMFIGFLIVFAIYIIWYQISFRRVKNMS